MTLRHGPIVLAPIRPATAPPGSGSAATTAPGCDRGRRPCRQARRSGPDDVPGPRTDADQAGQGRADAALAGLLRLSRRAGKAGAGIGQLTVSGIVGGSASWGQIGYWIDERLRRSGDHPDSCRVSGRLLLPGHGAASDRDRDPAGEHQEPAGGRQARASGPRGCDRATCTSTATGATIWCSR